MEMQPTYDADQPRKWNPLDPLGYAPFTPFDKPEPIVDRKKADDTEGGDPD